MSERTLNGVGATPLSDVGTVIWYRPDANLTLPELPSSDNMDSQIQYERFETARDSAQEELETERERVTERIGAEEAAVFDAHIQFLNDPQIEESVMEAIDDSLPAEHAVHEAFSEPISQFEQMEGRMAERADDLRDVRDRLIRILTGANRADLGGLPEESVILAERLTPTDTAQLDPDIVAGFATVTGGRTSHAAIFARSLALPAVVGVGEMLHEIEDNTEVIVDGDAGEVISNPNEETRRQASQTSRADIRSEPVATADGEPIEVAANVGSPFEIEGAVEQGADGIGLFRTEFLFLDRDNPPNEDEQYKVYRDALSTFPERRVVVRTLDIGGDKPIPYLNLAEEENPFLGERGIRRSLEPDTELFKTQLRALLRAAGETESNLAIMFPLIATVEEFEAARNQVVEVKDTLEAAGASVGNPEIGLMIETPATAFMGEAFAARADFLSIGTNDLTQYVLAADRGNEHVADLHDPRQPAVLRAISRTIDAAAETDAWVGMCGEMAGDPDLTELLLGLGLDELSMSAVTIPDVKAQIVNTNIEAARTLAERALHASTKREVSDLLTKHKEELE
jgi:phosphotransferase system enzyme I (PtsI)